MMPMCYSRAVGGRQEYGKIEVRVARWRVVQEWFGSWGAAKG